MPIIQSLWIGSTLSTMQKLSIVSFLQNNHPFHLYVYDDVQGVPEGCVLKDASTILPASKIFKYKQFNTYAGFANLFRYKLILEKGGYWVDTDVVCLKPFPETAYLFATERVRGSRVGYKAANAIFCAPPGAMILEYCYQQAVQKNPEQLKWGETGPSLVSYGINKFALHNYLAQPEVFCPINWWNWQQYIYSSLALEKFPNSLGLHLWHEMWRRNNINKNDVFASDSIYEKLKQRYLKNDEI